MKQAVTEKHKPPAEERTSSVATPSAQKLQRQPLLVVLAVLLVSAGAVSGLWLWASSTSATEVVAVRVSVERGHVITESDLSVVRVSVDPSVETIPSAQSTPWSGAGLRRT